MSLHPPDGCHEHPNCERDYPCRSCFDRDHPPLPCGHPVDGVVREFLSMTCAEHSPMYSLRQDTCPACGFVSHTAVYKEGWW